MKLYRTLDAYLDKQAIKFWPKCQPLVDWGNVSTKSKMTRSENIATAAILVAIVLAVIWRIIA